MGEQSNLIGNIRIYLKHKIINNKTIITTYEKERQLVYNIIKLTITNGESNSALLMGPKESGKSTLIKSVLESLDNNLNLGSNTIKIELNGLIHTDDKLALKSCTYQMNLENAVAGKVFTSFADNLSYLLECLRSGERKTFKSLLFIIEEFDLFCFHDNQTLLYNLLDMTHNGEIPICVIGITSRLDVVELFEKRVKSRFSHRVINLFPNSDDIESRLEMIEKLLVIDVSKPTAVSKFWNAQIANLIKDKKFKSAMKRLYDLTTSERVLKNVLIQIISQLSAENSKLKPESFAEEVKKFESGCRSQLLRSLSVLEIGLLIAMTHHTEIFDQPFNFEMILERFNKFATGNRSLSAPRDVVLKAFEHVKFLELIASSSGAGHNRARPEYELHTLVILPTHLREAITSMQLPTELTHWYNAKIM